MITINLTHVFLWCFGALIIWVVSPDDFKEEMGMIGQMFFQGIWGILCLIVFHFYTFNLIMTKI